MSIKRKAGGKYWVEKEIVTFYHNAVAQDDTSLPRCSGAPCEYGTQLNVSKEEEEGE